jgi:hypothetical protein
MLHSLITDIVVKQTLAPLPPKAWVIHCTDHDLSPATQKTNVAQKLVNKAEPGLYTLVLSYLGLRLQKD